jgi:hypothetical protein
VVRSRDGVATNIREQNPLQGPRILFQGRDDTIWIGAADGVLAWRDGHTRLVRLPSADRPAEVANFYQDAAGTLWMATKGGASAGCAPMAIASPPSGGPGAATGWIVQLLEDGYGRLWASSSQGVFWVSRRELDEVAEGRRERVQPSLYDANDGVQMRADPFGHPAGVKDGQGRLWFATMGGLAVVDPRVRGVPPRVLIEQLRVGGHRIEPGAGEAPLVTGAPADLDLTVSGLSFASPDTLSFRYRLRRSDPDWIEVGASRTVHHPRLPAGDYQLAIQARTREGEWVRPAPCWPSAAAAVSTFARLPGACWRWGGAAAGATRTGPPGPHPRRLQAVMAERTRLAREIHDTLAQAFVATSVQLECLEEALEAVDRRPSSARSRQDPPAPRHRQARGRREPGGGPPRGLGDAPPVHRVGPGAGAGDAGQARVGRHRGGAEGVRGPARAAPAGRLQPVAHRPRGGGQRPPARAGAADRPAVGISRSIGHPVGGR